MFQFIQRVLALFGAGRALLPEIEPEREIPPMRNFVSDEFGVWWPRMDIGTLESLDRFRDLWGAPVSISAHPDALGRYGKTSKSAHNIDRWGRVYAADIFPHGMNTKADRLRAVLCALRAGFRGVGLYPNWRSGSQRGGLHVDRRDRIQTDFPTYARGRDFETDPAFWARFDSGYVLIDAALPRGHGVAEIVKLWKG